LLFLLALLVFVNLYFAYRSVYVATHSHASIRRGDAPDDALPPLSIVVPARNEARQIAGCVRSLLAQRYPHFEVIAVDDRSTDDTRAILAGLEGKHPRLRVVDGAELPDGWVGKPWALTQGAAAATGSWLLFTDADTVHEPLAAASAVATALAGRYDALSLLTDQQIVTLGERIALPSILWTIALGTGSLDEVNDPNKRDNALFNGQYVLMRRDAYDTIGGHAAVRAEIAEDLELARLLKRDGRFRTALVGADALVRTRMYRSFRETWDGFVKNFALGLRGKPWLTAIAILYFALLAPVTPLVVVWLLAAGAHGAAAIVLGAMIAAIGSAEFGMRRFRLPAGSGVWLPVGMTVMLAIFVTSLVAHARGGVTWRGRRY
jgi:chlorobactene glucosyltransferase